MFERGSNIAGTSNCAIRGMGNRNKQAQGAAYRVNTLNALAVLGYASARQIAGCVWGRCDESARRMASRTLRKLLDRRLVVSKRDGEGINRANYELLFALTLAGANEVRNYGSELIADKVHARDYLRHAHEHRTVCNSVYAALHGQRWSELQIRSGECPLSEFHYRVDGEKFSKIPDVVVAHGKDLEWIEVENSWRSDKDLVKIINCMRAMFLREQGRITCMHFIVAVPGARTIGRRLKSRLTHGLDSGWPRQIRELDTRILSQHLRVSEIDLKTLELRTLAL